MYTADLLETARLLRFTTDWERRFAHYEILLLTAGIGQERAIEIVTAAEADRAALDRMEKAA
ncbi:MAG: hypothetical protein EOS79_11440 [Mesorhizobium sp.]|nr:MAG: hypothetical protein EOS79_11440 [Mesorhizobium sp.]